MTLHRGLTIIGTNVLPVFLHSPGYTIASENSRVARYNGLGLYQSL